MTDEQGLSLARLMRDRPNATVRLERDHLDLPADYVCAVFEPNYQDRPTFVCGIAPDGRVSS